MKLENIILVIILVFIFGGLIYTAYGLFDGSKNIDGNTIKNQFEINDDKFERKTSNGEVIIDLQPHKVENGKLIFDIGVNTHTVDLSSYDLIELTTLEYKGKSVKPISAPRLTEHHTSGELVFDVEEEIESFKIIIKGVPDVEIREFEW